MTKSGYLTKHELLWEIVQNMALLYEVSFQGPGKYGEAIEKLNGAMHEIDIPEGRSINAMAREYLNWVYGYKGSTQPSWWPE